MTLRNLDQLLQEKLPSNIKIKDYSTKKLTVVGDNYGSTMLSLTVCLENKVTGEDEDQLELVAKMCPTSPDFYAMFQVDKTFIKESGMYTIVAPILKAFQLEKNVPEELLLNSFVNYWGSQKSLNPLQETVDKDGVIILENIKFQGFTVGDRSKGFDLQHSEFILKGLAQFHATLIAYRKEHPEEFQKSILPYLAKIDMDAEVKPESMKECLEAMKTELKSLPEIASLVEMVLKQIEVCRKRQSDREIEVIEGSPFNTFCHGDFWVNNVMIAYDHNGDQVPKRMKIIDFQFIKFASVVEDILFFIFTSVEEGIIPDKIDHLLNVYHRAFVEYLTINGCPLDEFSRERFLHEINDKAKYELYHIIMMVKIILLDKDKMAAMDELSEDLVLNPDLLGANYFKKLQMVVLEFNKRGWLLKD